MESNKENIFQRMLKNEYEKNKNSNFVDIVASKRKQFQLFLNVANEDLKNGSFNAATSHYFCAIDMMRNDEYPDEYGLSPEAEFSLKCCFCYSGFMNVEFLKEDRVNNLLIDTMKELNDKFKDRLFPKYIFILYYFHRKNWLLTLNWCNNATKIIEEKGKTEPYTEVFKPLLPKFEKIRDDVERFEETAFYGYSEIIRQKHHLKPRLDKYLNGVHNLNYYVKQKLAQSKAPLTEVELHNIFHHDIFPIWCLVTGKEESGYFSRPFLDRCTKCKEAMFYNRDDTPSEDMAKFNIFVDKCMQFYKKCTGDLVWEIRNIKDISDCDEKDYFIWRLKSPTSNSKSTSDTEKENIFSEMGPTKATNADHISDHNLSNKKVASNVDAKPEPQQQASQKGKKKGKNAQKGRPPAPPTEKENVGVSCREIKSFSEICKQEVEKMAQVISLMEIGGGRSFIAKRDRNAYAARVENIKVNKYSQTEGNKSKKVEETRVNVCEPQILNAVLEIKNKFMANQERNEGLVVRLNKKIHELHEKLNKETASKKNIDLELEKKATHYKMQIDKLTEKLTEVESDRKELSEKSISLQKLLVEQINDKYNLYKQHYKDSEKQAFFMVTYLKELVSILTPRSTPTDQHCRQNIELWEKELQAIKHGLENLNTFYQNVKVNIINSDKYNVTWPDMPELPRYDDNIIFVNFKTAIKGLIQLQENLYWKYNGDSPVQLPHQCKSAYPQQNNVFMRGGLYLTKEPVYSRCVSVPDEELPPQQIQKRGRPPSDSARVNEVTAPLEHTMRTSHSMEYLNRGEGSHRNCVLVDSSHSVNKRGGKREKEELLLDYVLDNCPGATEEEVTMAMLKLLNDNKGTLQNLPKEKILENVRITLRMKRQGAWVTPKSPHVDWKNDHTQRECSICFEEFSSFNKYTLPCQHEYHKECIKKWLRTSSVCPICRIHCVIDEDFPPLH